MPIFFILLASSIHCEEIQYGSFTKTVGNFADNRYIQNHLIEPTDFTYEASEGLADKPFSNALRYDTKLYWCSKDPVDEDNPKYVTIHFFKALNLDGFTIGLSYRTPNVRIFSGAPLEVNVYTSSSDEPLNLKYFFNGTYDNSDTSLENVQFIFDSPIKCDTLKLEFLKVTEEIFWAKGSYVTFNQIRFFEHTGINTIGVTGDYANPGYVNQHQIPSFYFDAFSSGERENYPLSNLFDDNINTFWIASEAVTPTFKNFLSFEFREPVTLEGFLYDSKELTWGDIRYLQGFPTKLRVYAALNDEPEYIVCLFFGTKQTPADWLRMQFIFPEPVKCTKLRLEFMQVTPEDGFSHTFSACCGGLTFLQYTDPQLASILTEFDSLFTDYAQFSLNESFTPEKIEDLKTRAKQVPTYETDLKPLIDRVDAIQKGQIKKDPHREFSTKPGSRNMIEQFGDSVDYCRKVLKFNSFGTLRQVIGIGGTAYRPITIYVDAEPMEGQTRESVKLPTITFSQIYGTWQHSFETRALRLGRNSFICPNIEGGTYEVKIAKGGPIHINNPYSYETQLGHVRIYIEGGYVYPVFRKNDDENSFRIILKNYYDRLNDPNDDEITVDAFEALSDHVMTSCTCSLAYDYYINRNKSPQRNIDSWDNYLGELLKFGGVPFDPSNHLYNPMNDHVRQNFRAVQPFAGFFAYASSEMIGLPMTGTHPHLVDLTVPGWAIAHEFGHTVDKPGRIWGENTNNMWAIYCRFFMEKNIGDRIPISSVHRDLGPDLSDWVTHKNNKYKMESNPTIWWILEGAHPGYWAESEYYFVYGHEDRYENGTYMLESAERFIYYASLIFGHNMSYYFERWGFCMYNGYFDLNNRWSYEKSTDNFKALMNQAKANNSFDEEVKKYWYVNLDQYRYLVNHDNKLDDVHCYTLDEYVQPTSIERMGSNYIISLPEIERQDSHLCYEIQSFIEDRWVVLGVTYTQAFTDTYDYQGAEPKYKIYAYDRRFNHTGDPPEDSEDVEIINSPVCKINETYYDTLEGCINASEAQETILLLRSFPLQQQLNILKDLRIMPDENLTEPIIITKIGNGDFININTGNTGSSNVRIGDNDRVKIIINGAGEARSGSLIKISRTKRVYLQNVELINNKNQQNGGAIYVDYNSHIELDNCLIEKCSSTQDGGAICLTGGYQGYYHCELHLTNTTFRDNTAGRDGGAIIANGHNGYSKLVIRPGCIFENNVAGGKGGAIFAIKYEEIDGAIFRDNKAKNGGAIYSSPDSMNHEFKICSSNFTSNVATNLGSDIYIERSKLILNGGMFEGQIYKVNGTKIQFKKFTSNEAKIPDFDNCTFLLDLPDGGTPLIDEIDNPFLSSLPDAIDTIHVENGYAEYDNESRTIKALPLYSVFTATYDNEQYTIQVPHGLFTLPETLENFPEEKCIQSYKKDSQTYNVGDQVYINQDSTFEIVAVDTFTLTFQYNEKQKIERVIAHKIYYLPITTPDDEIVFGWSCSDGEYYAYADPVEITQDLIFTAVIHRKMHITVIIGDNTTVYEINYNEFFTLPEVPEVLNDLQFKYYDTDGMKKYYPNDSVQVLSDMTFTALYTNSVTAVFVAGESRTSEEYQRNHIITLYVPGPENSNRPNSGREFVCWSINNTLYYPYEEYSITNNIQITAVYYLLNKSAPVTITYEVPNVLEETPHYANGTRTFTQTYSYLDNITLLGDDYFREQPNYLGYDFESQREIVFDYWLIKTRRYEEHATFGVTDSITISMVTKLSDKHVPPPTQSAMATPSQSTMPTSSAIPHYPFKTPPPREIVEVIQNGNVINTTDIPTESQKQYHFRVQTDDIQIVGPGGDSIFIITDTDKQIEIQQTEAAFGVKLDSNSKDVSIKLNQGNANMNIEGGGKLTIEANEDIKNIAINDVTVFNEILSFVTPDVESLEMNNLYMYGEATFNANAQSDDKPVKAKSATVYEGATAKVTNTHISEKVSIELNAVLSLDRVELSKVSELVISYSISSNGKASITGKIGTPPIKISLSENKISNAAKTLEVKPIVIASSSQADFSQCNAWKQVVDTTGTTYNNVECKADGNNMALIVSSSSANSKKNMLPVIIGVVAAVIVIAIAIVVVVVIKKRKRQVIQEDVTSSIDQLEEFPHSGEKETELDDEEKTMNNTDSS